MCIRDRKRADDICTDLNIDPSTRVSNLTNDEVAQIRKYIEANFRVEGDLRRDVSQNIRRKTEIGTYQGLRHRKGLPVRGQRTHTNARTRKGPRFAIAGKKKVKKNVPAGVAHIKASFNNTIINISNPSGETIVWTSGGSVGFKGSRKSTPYAAQVAAEEAVRRATEYGVQKLDIIISGTGAGRETAVRTLQNMGMDVGTIKDITPTPHNGCRPKKRRRG